MALGRALMAYCYILTRLELKRGGGKRQNIVETKNLNKLSKRMTKKDVTGSRAESSIGPQETKRTSRTSWGWGIVS